MPRRPPVEMTDSEQAEMSHDAARDVLASAIGRMVLPHGGRVERWSYRPADPSGFAIRVRARFPSLPGAVDVETEVVVPPSDWTLGHVAVDQLVAAAATAYGMATYKDEG